jgi:hypothetical protein
MNVVHVDYLKHRCTTLKRRNHIAHRYAFDVRVPIGCEFLEKLAGQQTDSITPEILAISQVCGQNEFAAITSGTVASAFNDDDA